MQPASTVLSDAQISEQAAQWLVLLDDQPDATTQQQFAQWLAQDPRHAEALQRIQHLLEDVEQLQTQPLLHKRILRQSFKTSKQQRRHLAYKASWCLAGLCSLALMMALQYAPLGYWTADQRNGSQSWRQQQLSDHSHIRIAGKTAFNLQFNPQQRKISLLQGNILLDVAKDPKRPFVVETQHGIIRALGTRFIVSKNDQRTVVSMLHSKTQILAHHNAAEPLILVAGQRIEIDGQGWRSSTPIQINPKLLEQAWQQHTLISNGESLTEVLDYLSMYYPGRIRFDRQAFASMHVTASLPLNDIHLALQHLARDFHLEIKAQLPYQLEVIKTQK
jgi:transmembrane sensor